MESLALTETCPDNKFIENENGTLGEHVPPELNTVTVLCLMALRLLSYMSLKKKENGYIFGYNFHIWCFFTEISGMLFSFHIFSAVLYIYK